jgi:hypothetical protein
VENRPETIERYKMKTLKCLVVIFVIFINSLALAFTYSHISGDITNVNIKDTDIDLIHGRVEIVNTSSGMKYCHGTFEADRWLYDDHPGQAKWYCCDADSLGDCDYITFPNDMNHRNIVDYKFSAKLGVFFVQFMGGDIVTVDPETMEWKQFNQHDESIAMHEMGMVVIGPFSIYRISQTIPTVVTQYDESGKELNRTKLNNSGGHGGLFYKGLLYVSMICDDDNQTGKFYILNSTTLEVLSEHKIDQCKLIAPDFAILDDIYGNGWLFFGCEGKNQNNELVNNLFVASYTNPSQYFQYNTNTVKGGIWGVSAREKRIWISRGSKPGTIESIDPWTGRSVTYKLPQDIYNGVNGGVDVVGNRIYFKLFRRPTNTPISATNPKSCIGYIEVR